MPLYLYYEWLAYAQYFNPLAFSEKAKSERLEWGLGANTAVTVNTLTALFAKWGTRYKPVDFMPKPLQQGYKKPQTPKEIYEAIKAHLILSGNLKPKQ